MCPFRVAHAREELETHGDQSFLQVLYLSMYNVAWQTTAHRSFSALSRYASRDPSSVRLDTYDIILQFVKHNLPPRRSLLPTYYYLLCDTIRVIIMWIVSSGPALPFLLAVFTPPPLSLCVPPEGIAIVLLVVLESQGLGYRNLSGKPGAADGEKTIVEQATRDSAVATRAMDRGHGGPAPGGGGVDGCSDRGTSSDKQHDGQQSMVRTSDTSGVGGDSKSPDEIQIYDTTTTTNNNNDSGNGTAVEAAIRPSTHQGGLNAAIPSMSASDALLPPLASGAVVAGGLTDRSTAQPAHDENIHHHDRGSFQEHACTEGPRALPGDRGATPGPGTVSTATPPAPEPASITTANESATITGGDEGSGYGESGTFAIGATVAASSAAAGVDAGAGPSVAAVVGRGKGVTKQGVGKAFVAAWKGVEWAIGRPMSRKKVQEVGGHAGRHNPDLPTTTSASQEVRLKLDCIVLYCLVLSCIVLY